MLTQVRRACRLPTGTGAQVPELLPAPRERAQRRCAQARVRASPVPREGNKGWDPRG